MSLEMKQVLFIALCLMLVVLLSLALLSIFYKHAPQGSVWIRRGWGGISVSFGGMIVLPLFHRLESLDITAKKIELKDFGERAPRTKDKVSMDARVGVVFRIPPTEDGVLEVARACGVKQASDSGWLDEMFRERLETALAAALQQFTWQEIENSLEPLKLEFRRKVGTDLLGFVMEDVSFGHLAKPPESRRAAKLPVETRASKQ